jgi:hypothetical protein
MKKIILVASLLLAFAGVASASSLNGDYKGNPIVIVKSDGKPLETDEVPAMIYDGHTVVPISLLRQLGASVTWDASTYSVDVKIANQNNRDISKVLGIANDIEMFRYLYFINEQAALASQIMSGIIPNSVSQSDIKKALDQVDRLAVDYNNTWITNLSKIPVYSGDMDNIYNLSKNFANIKKYLAQFDTNSAHTEWLALKNTINMLYSKYDTILQNDESYSFEKVLTQNK